MEFRGPKGKLEYKRNMRKRLGMIAGGSGITPIYPLIDNILNDPLERTQISLIYANHSEQDIIFRNKLESFASQFPDRLKLYLVLTQVRRMLSCVNVCTDDLYSHLVHGHKALG